MAEPHILVGANLADPVVRRIAPADLVDALAKGWEDFSAMPSHAIFLCLIYPIIGIGLAGFRWVPRSCPCSFLWRPASPCSGRLPHWASMSSAAGGKWASTSRSRTRST